MRKVQILPIVLSVVLLLILSLGPGLAQGPAQAGRAGQGSAPAGGPPPIYFNYQGLLLDSAGNPVADDDYEITFAIYDVAATGTALWSETQTVAVENGLFNATLGISTTIEPAWADGRSLWLGITLQGEPEMYPRTLLTHVPYAANANDVRGSDIHPVSVAALSSGTAISGTSVATVAAYYGVQGNSHSTAGVGVYGTAPTTGTAGIATATSGVSYGVYGQTNNTSDLGGYGVYGTGGSFAYGVYGHNTSTGPGLGVYGRKEGGGSAISGLNGGTGNGLWGSSDGYNGVGGRTNRGDNNYGVYTEDNLYSANFHSLGAIMHIVQNGDVEALERGDLVEIVGLSEAPAVGMPPIIQVRKARTAHSTAILGVVDSSYADAWLSSAPADPTGASVPDEAVPLSTPGPIAPGDYLLIVVQGPCQVKVDATAGPIAVGDLLVSATLAGHAAGVPSGGAAGTATAAPGTVLGKALETAKPGQRLLYVYVTLR